ncbi:MAG: BtaA family protein [Acidimicrobiia bacterium]|nr:BtaA family protein [Acidimicrobiia bacterium]
MSADDDGFAGLRYSRVWEDPEVAVAALEPAPDGDILAVCSAGCNVLALVIAGAGHVRAVDVNETQLALAELVIAAAAVFGLDEYRTLLGVAGPGADDSGARLELYRAVRPHLGDTARNIWDARAADVEFGLVHAGKLERYFRGFRSVLPDDVDAGIAAVVAAPDLEAQIPLVDGLLADGRLRAAVLEYYSTERLAAGGRHASQYRYVDVDDTASQFFDRLTAMMRRSHVATNPYLRLFLDATYPHDDTHLPPHLTAAGHARLGAAADRVDLVKADLRETLEASQPGSLSGLYLSDMPEYHAPADLEDLLRLAATRVRAGGRVIWWSLLVPRPLPSALGGVLVDQADVATDLHGRDRVFFYRSVHVAEVAA